MATIPRATTGGRYLALLYWTTLAALLLRADSMEFSFSAQRNVHHGENAGK
jgi:hypothetical protein